MHKLVCTASQLMSLSVRICIYSAEVPVVVHGPIISSISSLDRLESLDLTMRSVISDPCLKYMGSAVLRSLTRLTSLCLHGVLDPRQFEQDVCVLATLSALKELRVVDEDYYEFQHEDVSEGDGWIAPSSVIKLTKGLRGLLWLVVEGEWIEMGEDDWRGSRVTSNGESLFGLGRLTRRQT